MKTVLALNNQFPTEENKRYGLVSGVSYYRQVMPGKHLAPDFDFHHLGHKLVDLPAETAEQDVAEMVKNHDIVFTKHLDNPAGIYMLLGACDFYDRPLIVDFDDDVFASDGKEHNRYVYPEGSEAKHYVETLIREASAITVSTEPLVEVYSAYNPNVFLCPNGVDMADWGIPKRKRKELVIGWPASTGHIVDHDYFRPAIEEILAKHEDVVFSVLGHYTPEMLQGLPRAEIREALPFWSGHPKDKRTYPSILADMGLSIGVAPIIESRYNKARSLAKWFEYTMTGVPVVASRYGPYMALQDNLDVLLASSTEEWVEKLEQLIKNPDERDRIARAGRDRIERDYAFHRLVNKWAVVFQTTKRFRSR